MTRNLPFGTGCALRMQVLLLMRLPEMAVSEAGRRWERFVESSEAVGASLKTDYTSSYAANREIARAGTAQP